MSKGRKGHDAVAGREFAALWHRLSRPPAPELSEAEAAVVARFEAADYPSEVVEARLAASIEEGERQIASGEPFVTLDDLIPQAEQ